MQSNLDRCNIDRSLDPTDDCTWANRIVVHCAEVINFCFSDDDHTVRRWAELKEYNQQWVKAVPGSFSPIYFQEAERESGEVFPQIWHIGDSHGKSGPSSHTNFITTTRTSLMGSVTGIQHYILSMILLAVYNPRLPRLGPGQKAALLGVDDEVKTNIRSLCGMALSNRKTPPHMITACMGISMCESPASLLQSISSLLQGINR